THSITARPPPCQGNEKPRHEMIMPRLKNKLRVWTASVGGPSSSSINADAGSMSVVTQLLPASARCRRRSARWVCARAHSRQQYFTPLVRYCPYSARPRWRTKFRRQVSFSQRRTTAPSPIWLYSCRNATEYTVGPRSARSPNPMLNGASAAWMISSVSGPAAVLHLDRAGRGHAVQHSGGKRPSLTSRPRPRTLIRGSASMPDPRIWSTRRSARSERRGRRRGPAVDGSAIMPVWYVPPAP
ncbi:hypothetical protein ABH935_010035, partial [Catenulispora sp. GAS73]